MDDDLLRVLDVGFIPTTACLGWKAGLDGTHIAIGFRQINGLPLPVGIPHDIVPNVIAQLIDATQAAPQRIDGDAETFRSTPVSRYKFDRSDATDGKLVLALYTPTGGRIAFDLPPELARQLAEALAVTFLNLGVEFPASTSRN